MLRIINTRRTNGHMTDIKQPKPIRDTKRVATELEEVAQRVLDRENEINLVYMEVKRMFEVKQPPRPLRRVRSTVCTPRFLMQPQQFLDIK